jgi:hypothetical protein
MSSAVGQLEKIQALQSTANFPKKILKVKEFFNEF